MMDCNKEEAIRAKRIAEKKMQNKGFVGARKILLKAQQLCPELENVSKMLTVCDVHCSAEHKMFESEMDWYGILQIEQTADEASIKKQYRKLASLLHPDKNNFFGAEAAFKLIGEAQRILSDQGKRSLHDMKRRASLGTAAPKQQVNMNSYVRKQPGVQNSFVNIASPQTMDLNPHHLQQQTQQAFSNIPETFWTICPFCGIRYQYYRDIVNRALRCKSCTKPFIAYDSNAQGVPPGANWSHAAFPQQKKVPNQGADKVVPQCAFGNIPSSIGVQGNFGSGTMASELFPKTGRTSEVGRGSKTKGKEDGNVDMEVGKEGGRKAGKPKESEPLANTGRKRRNLVVESSDSCNTGSSTDTEDDDVIEEDSGLSTGPNLRFTWGHYRRRSARLKRHVSYNENLSDDDDLVRPTKRLKGSASSRAAEESKEASLKGELSETDKLAGFAAIVEKDKKEVKQKACTPLEESLPNRNGQAEECKANGNESAAMDVNERSKVDEESESRLNPNFTPNQEYYEYPDPDFSDFDKEKREDRNSYVNKQPGVQSSFVNITTPQTMDLNPHHLQQQTQQGFSNIPETFCTICPFCGIRYQYYRYIVNRALRCKSCTKPFIAYDSNAQGVPPGANWSQPAFPQQKEIPIQGADKVGPQSAFGNIPSSMGVQGNFGSGTTASEQFPKTGRTSEVGRGSKTKGKEDGNVDMEVGKEGGRKAGKPKESEPLGNTGRRRRNSVVESSDNCDTGSSTDTEDDDVIEEDSGLSTGPNLRFTGGHYHQRSARKKQQVSYNENLSGDDDLVSPTKRLKGSASSRATEASKEASLKGEASETDKPAGFAAIVEKDEEVKQKACTPLEESLPNRNGQAEECKANGNKSVAMDVNERSKVDEESESRLNPNGTPNEEYYEYPDPDFSDFDKERREECFAADQIWAVYYNADVMPRVYVRIRKVFSPGFKLQIIWLDPDPDDQDEIDWVSEDLPVGCGKFKNSYSQNIVERLMFSHMVYWERGSSRGPYKIYPRKGEIWALFKNWDIKWSSDPDNHRQYEFEFVEVLSDYVQEAGINVTYLGKVKGFISLFSRTIMKGVVSFVISTSELFRFSHRIPSFRMTGKEREDVLEGSFELDPAALPANLEEFSHPGNVKVGTGSMDTIINGSCPAFLADRVKHMSGSEKPNMQKNSIDLEEENAVERRNSKSENQSSEDLNGANKKPGASQCAAKGETSKHLDGIKDSSHDESFQAEGSAFTDDTSFPPAFSAEEIPEAEFYDFDGEKSQEKFQLGQTWALYCDLDGMPKYYACINKIESSPDFKLHVSWLEAISLAKDTIQWLDKDMPLCCGTFKLRNGKSDVFYNTSFSHQLRAESTGKKNRYDIYPRKGEVWALYKNWKSEWTCLDLNKNCEYDIVQVLEDNDLGTKFLVLVPVDGFKLVFRAKRKRRSAIIEIPRAELHRFSHQIPAFQLTHERDGSLRGFWELDPASVPISFFRSN